MLTLGIANAPPKQRDCQPWFRSISSFGRERYAADISSTGPLHAHLDGFDLHAAVAVPATSEAASGSASAVNAVAPAPQPDGGVPAAPRPPPTAGYVRPRYYAWAALLERTFAVDVLACPDCGGRLRFVATIEDRAVIEKILRHLGLPIDAPAPEPARRAPWLPGFEPTTEWIPD